MREAGLESSRWVKVGALSGWVTAGVVAALAYALWPQPAAPPREPARETEAPGIPLPAQDAPVETWIRAANALMDHGQFEVAIRAYTHALARDSQNVPLWVDRGACRHALGDYEGAESDFRQALRLAPEHPTAHFNLGVVFFSRNLPDSARVRFSLVRTLAPASPEAERARALLSQLKASEAAP